MKSINTPDSFFQQDGFECETSKYGWDIKYTDSNKIIHGISVNYKALPRNSVKDFVLGYARCLAFQERWIDISEID